MSEVNEAAAQLLDGAADVVETQGHCKFIRQNDLGEVCLLGALDVAQYGRPLSLVEDFTGIYTSARVTAVRALYDEIGEPNLRVWSSHSPYHRDTEPVRCESSLVFWNNELERTRDEVVHHLRWAAKHLRAEETETVDA
jgi:hypothetical protein